MATVPLKVMLLTLHDCHLCEHARDVVAKLGSERAIVVRKLPGIALRVRGSFNGTASRS